MTYLDRILDDGSDHGRWLTARNPVIGASDAATLSKFESVDKYLAAKLATRTFSGNGFTESGHRWEPMMLAWAGIEPNKALIHSPQERGFASTPDGVQEVSGGAVLLGECKAKHMKVVAGPTLGEWRQIGWQFLTIPEADELEFVWVELDKSGELRADLKGEPKHLTIKRGQPEVQKPLALLLPIAIELLAQLTAALAAEREMNAA